ncbi:diguanylate cyclase [Halomonas vilamensis]|uniref:diguanylate cyclase n=1 Tax=Vreelandella vilamensis TaxID=531309 RepID=A0ABU1H1J5_9GAMM|nr:diguanylate cyclase [Halomonas vilamensis]MDR5898181.1 diguanylate cyclase [Halomonas vilamensis]
MRIRPRQFMTFVILLLSFGSGVADVSPAPLEHWEYRWGDSPRDALGHPLWLSDASPSWQAIPFPANPPERKGQQHAWFRTFLPDGEWRDPVLYITSIDLIAQLYLDNELIYQHGEFDAEGKGNFAGWPWHMVELPEDFAGKPVYIRVFSYYTDIGLWGEVKLMDRIDGFHKVIKHSATDLAVSAFSLVIAILAGIFALIGPERRGFAAIALFTFSAGLMLLAEAPARQLIAEGAMAWDILRASSYYMLPVAMGLLLSVWLEGRSRRWMARFWQLHLAYLVGAIGLVKVGAVSLSLTFPVFDLLLAVTLPLMLLIALRRFSRMGLEQRLLVLSFSLFAVLLLADMLVAHGVIAWRIVPLSVGTLAFSVAVAGISLWHYRETQRQLASLNQTLEDKVFARTAELDRLVNEFKGLSLQDALTGLSNRRHFDSLLDHEFRRAERHETWLSLLMLDLDHFKRINDTLGHDAGDAVLVEVAALLKQHFRGADVVCRLGGEEFVALLPGVSMQDAKARANTLLETLRRHEFRYEGRLIEPMTLSCGVATYPYHAKDPKQLLIKADEALYQAKNSGRDCCVICTPPVATGLA